MPIYEYKCEQCERCFEKLVYADDKEAVQCPQCGTRQVKKLMSCSRFIGEGMGGVCSSGTSGGFS